MLIAEGIPVVVSCAFGVFEDFGMEGAGGFGCPTVFTGFDLLFGLTSLVLCRVSSATDKSTKVCFCLWDFSKELCSFTRFETQCRTPESPHKNTRKSVCLVCF